MAAASASTTARRERLEAERAKLDEPTDEERRARARETQRAAVDAEIAEVRQAENNAENEADLGRLQILEMTRDAVVAHALERLLDLDDEVNRAGYFAEAAASLRQQLARRGVHAPRAFAPLILLGQTSLPAINALARMAMERGALAQALLRPR